MARRLLQRNILIDAFVSSPAKRAKKTARLFATTYGRSEEDIIYFSALYHAPAEVFFEVTGDLDDQFDTVALFAHNPGITHFVNELAPDMPINNMPTCSVFAISAAITHWSDFARGDKKFLFFDFPKNG